jgi:hypothetical protein
MKKIVLLFFAVFIVCLAFGEVRTQQRVVVTSSGGGIALDNHLDHYYAGNGAWGTFDNLWQDPADSPQAPRQFGDLLYYGTKWSYLRMGAAGTVLKVSDDPGVFGIFQQMYWGLIDATNLNWTPIKITGSPANSQVTYWKPDGTHVTGDSQFTYDDVNHILIVGGVTVGGGSSLTNLDSGIYTPVGTAGANVDSVSVDPASGHWMRIGNQVTVTGEVIYSPTSGTAQATDFYLSLPIASGLSIEGQLAGVGVTPFTASTPATTSTVVIHPDTVSNRAHFSFASQGSAHAAHQVQYTYTYSIQ